MYKTQALMTILVVSFEIFLHTPVWGQSTPAMREIGAMVATAAPVELASDPVTVRVAMRGEARAQVEAAMAPSSKTRLALTVEETVYDIRDGHYEIYINLPKNEVPSYKSVYFVGNLSPFLPHSDARGQPYAAGFDITRNVRELRSSNAWNDAELSVTFVMRGTGVPVPPGARARVSNVTVAAFSAQ